MIDFDLPIHSREGGDPTSSFNVPAQPGGTPACAGASAESEI